METSKENAAKYLQNIGYEAEVINGVVTVIIPEEKIIDMQAGKIMRKLKKTLAQIGYTASMGVKAKSDKADNG